MALTFSQVVVVDWSASAVPKRGADSIWMSVIDVASGDLLGLTNPPTRIEAREELVRIVGACTGRVLIGADFPMGPPAGYTKAIGADCGGEVRPWLQTWQTLSELVADDSCNCNNRFAVAAELNRRIGQLQYWGTPARQAGEWLTVKKPLSRQASARPAEFRTVERLLRAAGHRPFSWWQLYGAGSVGSQILTGIPVMNSLRIDPGLSDRVVVWPFETGMSDPLDGLAVDAVVMAEVWPSMSPAAVIDEIDHPVKDARQVVSLAQRIAAADRVGALPSWFAPAVDDHVAGVVVDEEGWVLGVTASGQPITEPVEPASARTGVAEFTRQRGFDIRFEWGPEGLAALAPEVGVVILVDILRFTTAVSAAVQRGTVVLPYRWNDATAEAFARRHGAALAGLREHGRQSLSPADLLHHEPVERLVLPSPNGSAMSLDARALGVRHVLAGSLRNAAATARLALRLALRLAEHEAIAVIACGERWGQAQGPLRPAIEDAIGAGAVIDALLSQAPQCRASPEARAASAAFADVRNTLFETLCSCASGVELIVRGWRDDVAVAAQFDVSPVAARLTDVGFEPVR